MLDDNKKQILNQILASFSKEEILWTSGYLAGSAGGQASAEPQLDIAKNITILYVTETGNSKFLSGEIAKKLKSQGVAVKMKSSDQYRLNDFAKEKNLIVVASTHGEGEIPESGKKFFDHINQNELDLKALNYVVVALGDTNYPLFCQAGKDIDKRLEDLGAKRAGQRIDLDLDFEDSIEEIKTFAVNSFAQGGSVQAVAPKKSSGKSEYEGEIVSNINLNDIDSSKETYHIEIAVDDELNYEPGDSIGILIGNEELGVEGDITPRLYSIASSVNEHGNEVHLTVSLLRYKDENGNEVEGLFSGYLSRLKDGDNIKFYISKNRQFKLPADDKNIIMVGPGTGIAPFRAFVGERNYRDAAGKNWLFFGERNFRSDFLYQSEWQDYLTSGILTKIDVAFSRDQEQKIYVQDRIRENGKELYEWLENGAYFYICGDKENMAKDVENCLIEVISTQGGKTKEEAEEYLSKLVEEDRYLKDVY